MKYLVEKVCILTTLLEFPGKLLGIFQQHFVL